MKTAQSSLSLGRFALGAVTLLLAAATIGMPTRADASTAAGTQITNIAHVNYSDSAGIPVGTGVDSLPVIVTVTRVVSAVNITRDLATNTVFEGATTTVNYTVVGTANGSDSYTIAPSETPQSAFITTVNGTSTPVGPITLAGTTLAADTNGTNIITVPYDATGATGVIVGTILRIGGNNYTVNNITTNAPANTTALTMSAVVPAGPTTGTVIGEYKTFFIVFPSGVLSGASTQTQTAEVKVASTTTPAVTTTSLDTVITVNVNPATLTIVKSACANNALGPIACFGATANAKPGDIIIYKVVITNTGSGVAKAVTITDTLQKYLTYVMAAAKAKFGATGSLNGLDYNNATFTALTEGVGGYTVLPVGTPDATLRRSITYTLGATDLPAANELVLFYEATVN